MYNEQNVCNNIISQMLDEYNEDFFEDITALKCNYDDIVMSRCCKKYCLQRKVLENSPGTVDKSVEIVRKCRDEIRTMGREEKRNYFTPIINSFLKRKNPRTQKWDKLVICIGSAAAGTLINRVCRRAFCNAYGISHRLFDDICKELKCGVLHKRSKLDDSSVADIEKNTILKNVDGIDLSLDQIINMYCPNTPRAKEFCAWLANYIRYTADIWPNRENVIHIPKLDKREVYGVYCRELKDEGSSVLSYKRFIALWGELYNHVKERPKYGVMGHCDMCSHLQFLRTTYSDKKRRVRIKELFAFHRSAYMGERMEYYKRIRMAKDFPNQYISMISDGMQQAHSQIPWCGGNSTFTPSLNQHLQGVLEHGKSMRIFRTFPTVKKDGNVAIHAFLMALEERYKENNNELPRTLFLQIDGGQENVTLTMFGICELLIVRGLVDKIFVTRLLVGHSHEDIDGKFARIWKRLMGDYLDSPQQYARAVCSALKHATEIPHFHDIFVVPDYDGLIRPYMDYTFGRYCKDMAENQWTQHAFVFEKVERSTSFPLGVRAFYKLFSSDKSVIIKQDNIGDLLLGYSAWEVLPVWLPKGDEESGIPPGLSTLYTMLPNRLPEPVPLVPGSTQLLEQVYFKVLQSWGDKPDKAVSISEWDEFYRAAPSSDDVQLYVRDNPDKFHIPFKGILFKGEAAQSQSHDAITEEERTSTVPPGISGRLVVRESVLWHNHALVTPGRRRVTAADNVPRTEVGWLYVDGQEVQLTPDDVLALRAAELAQRAQKRAASKRKRKKNDTAEENNTSHQEESLLRTDRGRRGNDRTDRGRRGINRSLRPANKSSARSRAIDDSGTSGGDSEVSHAERPIQRRKISRLGMQNQKRNGADGSDSEESSDSEVRAALKSLNDDDSYNSEEDGECSDQESTEDGGSGGKNDDSSSQNDASGEEDEEQEDEEDEEEGQDDEDEEHEDLEYGPPDSEGWVLEVKNFRIPIYGNTADRVGKLCFYQPNNATSACVLRVLAVVYEDLKRFYKVLHYKCVVVSSMKTSYVSGQILHIRCDDLLRKKNSTWNDSKTKWAKLARRGKVNI